MNDCDIYLHFYFINLVNIKFQKFKNKIYSHLLGQKFPPESKAKVVSTIKASDIEHNLDGLPLQQVYIYIYHLFLYVAPL